VSPGLEKATRAFKVAEAVRGWPQPSDHAPILTSLEI